MFITLLRCHHRPLLPQRLLAIALLSPLIVLLPSAARAQTDPVAQQSAQALKTLSTPSQQVIEKLSQLNHLPAGEWRFHAGDVEHGEAVDLDDSSWPIVQPGAEAPNEAVWYRRVVEVPKTLNGYDLTGSRIWFHFLSHANGPIPQIIYFNGRRVAMGEDLEPIVLLDQAKPGDKVLVAVKLLQTVDKKRFAGADMRIDFSPRRPSPEDLRLEFLSGAFQRKRKRPSRRRSEQ
jgi:alpha-mannosidase